MSWTFPASSLRAVVMSEGRMCSFAAGRWLKLRSMSRSILVSPYRIGFVCVCVGDTPPQSIPTFQTRSGAAAMSHPSQLPSTPSLRATVAAAQNRRTIPELRAGQDIAGTRTSKLRQAQGRKEFSNSNRPSFCTPFFHAFAMGWLTYPPSQKHTCIHPLRQAGSSCIRFLKCREELHPKP